MHPSSINLCLTSLSFPGSPLFITSQESKDKSQSLDHSQGSKSDVENSNSSDSDDSSKEEIPNDDLIVHILARLDGQSYNQALYQDAKTINTNFVMPQAFPYHSKKRLPQKLVKTMPRDIDDLQVITHCLDELHAPLGDKGPFGFGRYENGQSNGSYSNIPTAETPLSTLAAARRSQDPGVIELNAQLPLPVSMDALMPTTNDHAHTLAEKWQAKLLSDPKQAETLSHLPYHWGKRDRGHPYNSTDQPIDKPSADEKKEDDGGHLVNGGDFEMRKLAESRSNARTQIDLATSCVRKWKISMKVGGVSSRSTLFPSQSVIATKGDQVPENTRKVFRPMLSMASLPQSVQSGKTVPMEKASQMDKAGFAHSLGSYDCRFTDALLNSKARNRSKQIEVGRTRTMWSNLIQGDEPFLPSTRGNKVNFNSLLTGQRLDLSKCKRPKEVKVGVRLNGRIIMEEALEDLPTTTASSSRKRKISTRQADNEGGKSLKSSLIQCPESRTDEEIDIALHKHSIGETQEERALNRSTANGSVVYLELGSQPSSHSDIDRNDIIATLLKFNQKKATQKKLKPSASSDTISTETTPANLGGSQVIKQSNPPRFACVPLEDGLMRTVCLNAGNMSGAAVHQVLCEVAEQESGKKCSVCWSDEGEGKEGVQECVTCGLLAHSNCCRDKGEFSIASNGGSSNASDSIQNQQGHTNGDAKGPKSVVTADGECSNDHDQPIYQWQCAVCCRYKEAKPRRQQRMPSRYVDGETYTSSKDTPDNDTVNNRSANIPGPRCSLCPHRGGAMSQQLDTCQNSESTNNEWTHEVCRVWKGPDIADGTNLNESSSLSQYFSNGSPLSNVCALCGTGGVKSNKAIHTNAGLTRCAARGCHVAFHPMCALLASKVGIDDKVGKAKSIRTRKTRHSDQISEDKKTDDSENIDADKKLCKEYTLQLVQLSRTVASGEDKTTIIPVAFCGIHNPRREDRFYGCLPGGTAIGDR